MRLVVDANVICRSPKLRDANWQTVLKTAKPFQISLSIPEIVIEEAVKFYRSEVAKLGESIRRLELQDTSLPDLTTPVAQNYRDWLESQVKAIGEILPYPEIPHAIVARRALDGRKPFRGEDSGYRDTLVWESVLALAKASDSTVVFISNDSGFRIPQGDALHPDLQADLASREIKPERVRFFTGIPEFVHELIRPRLREVTEVIRLLEARAFPDLNLISWLEANARNVLAAAEGKWSEWDFPVSPTIFKNQGITTFANPRIVQITDVRRISTTELLISLEIDLDCRVSFHFFDFYLEVVREQFPKVRFLLPAGMLSRSWSMEEIPGETDVRMHLSVDLVFDEEAKQVKSLDAETHGSTFI